MNITIKLVFFACALFHEFRYLGDFVKITGHEYANFSVFYTLQCPFGALVQQAKMPELMAPN